MRRPRRRSLKQRVYRWLYRGLLSLAVGAALYVVIADQLTAAQWGQATVRYSRATAQMSAAAISRQRQMAISYNAMVRRRQQGDETARSAYRYRQILWLDAQGTMATLTIPAIHLKMPIRHGTDAHTLEQGIGHWPRSSLPIGGMSNRPIITGHSGIAGQILFTNIEKLRRTDTFYIQVLNRTLKYQITKISRVRPQQITQGNIVVGQDEATLLTCWPIGINTYRLLVTGRRVPYHPRDEHQPVAVRDWWTIDHLLLLGLVLLAGVGSLRYVHKKLRGKKK
jgi:sortase A